MPPELQADPSVTPHEFWVVLSQNPTAHLALHWAWAAGGIIGLAAVPAISQLVRAGNEGWVHWGSALAYLGFAVNARSHFMEVAFDRKIIPIYLQSDPATQKAVHVVAGLALDIPDGLITYGGIGLWVFVVSVLALRTRILPRLLCYVGILTAISYWLGVVGYTFLIQPLVVISIGLGGLILAPIWYIWIGLRSRSAGQTQQS
ncbi:MAG: hypothetical protein ACE5NW_01765 [Acidiferrobacterales bacterium]